MSSICYSFSEICEIFHVLKGFITYGFVPHLPSQNMTDYIKLFEYAFMHKNFSHSYILGLLVDVLSSLYFHCVDFNKSCVTHVSGKQWPKYNKKIMI